MADRDGNGNIVIPVGYPVGVNESIITMERICIVAENTEGVLPGGLKAQLSAAGTFSDVVLLETEALSSIAAADVTVVLLSRILSEQGLLDALKRKRDNGYEGPVIFISPDSTPDKELRDMIALERSGVAGIDVSLSQLLSYIQTLRSGRKNWLLAPPLQEMLLNTMLFGEAPAGFTEREAAVIREAQRGSSIDETARKLGISRHTVVSHRRNIFKKTGVRSIHKIRLNPPAPEGNSSGDI